MSSSWKPHRSLMENSFMKGQRWSVMSKSWLSRLILNTENVLVMFARRLRPRWDTDTNLYTYCRKKRSGKTSFSLSMTKQFMELVKVMTMKQSKPQTIPWRESDSELTVCLLINVHSSSNDPTTASAPLKYVFSM